MENVSSCYLICSSCKNVHTRLSREYSQLIRRSISGLFAVCHHKTIQFLYNTSSVPSFHLIGEHRGVDISTHSTVWPAICMRDISMRDLMVFLSELLLQIMSSLKNKNLCSNMYNDILHWKRFLCLLSLQVSCNMEFVEKSPLVSSHQHTKHESCE